MCVLMFILNRIGTSTYRSRQELLNQNFIKLVIHFYTIYKHIRQNIVEVILQCLYDGRAAHQ